MTITFTNEQAEKLVTQWNLHANEKCQITPDQAHTLFDDNSDYDMETEGCVLVEVPALYSKSGNPFTYYIMSEEVSLEE